ncbi:MAG TPA: RNA polymerase sigma factor SigZ [Caldilineaceae bacterium]|nr:RNA polymerase sigma factor SigZ [Caldilineaceae bacterium]
MVVETIYQELDAGLRQFIRRRVADAEDVEDIVQEVYLRIHRHIAALREEERLQSWVYQIARNAIVDYYRSRRMTTELAETIAAPEAPDRFDPAAQLAASLHRILDCLPDKDREALRLVELEGKTQQELAEHLGISLSGAKSRVQRAREKLKAALLDCCHFELDLRGHVLNYEPKCACCAGGRRNQGQAVCN